MYERSLFQCCVTDLFHSCAHFSIGTFAHLHDMCRQRTAWIVAGMEHTRPDLLCPTYSANGAGPKQFSPWPGLDTPRPIRILNQDNQGQPLSTAMVSPHIVYQIVQAKSSDIVRLQYFDTNWYPTAQGAVLQVFADPMEHMNYLQDFLGQTSVPFTLLQAQSAQFHFCPLFWTCLNWQNPCCGPFVLPCLADVALCSTSKQGESGFSAAGEYIEWWCSTWGYCSSQHWRGHVRNHPGSIDEGREPGAGDVQIFEGVLEQTVVLRSLGVAHGYGMPRNAKSFRKSRYRQNRKICSVCFKQIQGGSTNSPWRSDPIGRCDLARRLGFHKLGLRIGVRPQFQNALEELRLSISVRWAGEHKGSSVESAYVYSDLFFSMLICSSSHLLRSLIHFVAFYFGFLK